MKQSSNFSLDRNKLAFVFKELGEFTRRKQWFNFSCPYHGGDRHNFGVDVGRGFFKCLGCPEEGNLIRLYTYLRSGGKDGASWGQGLLLPEGVDEALLGRSSAAEPVSGPVDHIQNTYKFFERFTSCKDPDAESLSMTRAKAYLMKRSVDWHKYEVGIHADLPGRVVFPFMEQGEIKFYMGRAFEKMLLKTINPDSAKGWLPKSDVLFNYPSLTSNIIITEGVFDAISADQYQVDGFSATCLLGKTISNKQIQLLKKKAPEQIWVMLDADADKDAKGLALKLYQAGFKTFLCQWGTDYQSQDFKDPGGAPDWALSNLLVSSKLMTPELEFRLLLELS